MARPLDNLNDPRWEGQDSQSLPDRPAHPDPARRTEFGSAESVASHGIVGHLDAKIGLVSDASLEAEQARYHADQAADLKDAQAAATQRASDTGDKDAKADAESLKTQVAYHESLGKKAKDAPLEGGDAVREKVLANTIESSPRVDVANTDDKAKGLS